MLGTHIGRASLLTSRGATQQQQNADQTEKKIITSSVVTTTWNPEKGWRHRPMKSRMASPGRGKSLLQKRGHMAHWERSSVMCQLLFCGASRYLARCFLPVDGAERERPSGFSTVRRARNLTRGRGGTKRPPQTGWLDQLQETPRLCSIRIRPSRHRGSEEEREGGGGEIREGREKGRDLAGGEEGSPATASRGFRGTPAPWASSWLSLARGV